ncbi:Ribose 1,5-bisphosphate phosphokinase PhnN [Cedecea neteri]|uniref:Ribose 1,5-bisphosphate phosphokinase PhnN n=1 Tax=Cedecea neteri TaxID=158822 RepID=A0A2X2SYS8_9ENTR|nr:Ribose 1,5-bisphosphate phosphokinase PhnN [Cedecea neteri]
MSKLIWLMGPSGSGKDSLLSALRQQEHARLLVAHRYITRAADAGCENHIALSANEFEQRQQLGLFALSWQAHEHSYGVGVEMDIWLEAGFDVVVNGSRQHLKQARNVMAMGWCPSACRFPGTYCASGWNSVGGKTQSKSSSGCSGPRFTRQREAIA